MITAALAAVVLASVTPSDAVLDLTPAFQGGPAAQAKAAFDAGRHAEAAAKLAHVATPEARLLRAMALAEAGRAAEALAPLEGLEARLPDAADRISLLRGRALEAAGRGREAVAALAAVPDGSLVAGEARLARARLARRFGDRAQALEALAPLVSLPAPKDPGATDAGASALLLAGRVHGEGEGADPAAARRAFAACWAEHPIAPEAAECLAALRALPAPHGGEPGVEEQVRRAEALLEAGLADGAVDLLRKAVPDLSAAAPGEELACRARAALGRAHRKARSYADAVEALRPVVEGCDDPSVRVKALFLLAGATSNTGDKDGAIALYRRLARDYPRNPLADDALFSAADLLLRAGRDGEAREALAGIVRDHAGGDYWDEARFRLAWLSRRAGDLDGAIAQLLAIEEGERDLDPYEHARAAYWRARILAGRGDAGARAAEAIWTDLATRFPADYYGLLARARLAGGTGNEEGAARALPAAARVPAAAMAAQLAPPAWHAGPLAADPHFRAGVLLLRMGLSRDGAAELTAVDPARLSDPDAPDAALIVADLLDRAGDHRNAHQLLRTRARIALRRAPAAENLRVWRIAYPPAFRGDVQRWAPSAGVPVDLLQALMREESALDPRAVSPVGAIGLTQLMLPTAREVARQLKIRRPSRTDLMNGPLNIRIGARYLGQLLRRFDGRVALAVAAYNAGGGAVSRWLEARGDLELDEFVEEIPFEETRGYVKRVLRSYAAYRLLYGGGAPAGGLFRLAGR